MKTKSFIIFFVVCIGELFSVAVGSEIGQWLFKPLIMIVLGFYYYLGTVKNNISSKSVMVAILFSFLGDVSLMFQGENEIYFMTGLGSFLVAHVGYVIAYYQHKNVKEEAGLNGIQKFRFALPIVLAGTGLITILFSHLGALKIPVTIYSIVLMVMVLQALFRYGYTNNVSFWYVFIGALLFMISDAMIAINKFLFLFELSGLAIMFTYMLAQFFIIRGLVVHNDAEIKKAN